MTRINTKALLSYSLFFISYFLFFPATDSTD